MYLFHQGTFYTSVRIDAWVFYGLFKSEPKGPLSSFAFASNVDDGSIFELRYYCDTEQTLLHTSDTNIFP